MLRAIDKGFLVHEPDSPNIVFTPLGEVSRLERPYDEAFKGIVPHWFMEDTASDKTVPLPYTINQNQKE